MTAPVKTRKTEKPHPFYGKKLNRGVIRGFAFTFARDTYPSPSIIPYIFRYVKFYITFLYFLYENGIFLEEIYVGFFFLEKIWLWKKFARIPLSLPQRASEASPIWGGKQKFLGPITFRTYIYGTHFITFITYIYKLHL